MAMGWQAFLAVYGLCYVIQNKITVLKYWSWTAKIFESVFYTGLVSAFMLYLVVVFMGHPFESVDLLIWVLAASAFCAIVNPILFYFIDEPIDDSDDTIFEDDETPGDGFEGEFVIEEDDEESDFDDINAFRIFQDMYSQWYVEFLSIDDHDEVLAIVVRAKAPESFIPIIRATLELILEEVPVDWTPFVVDSLTPDDIQ